MKAYLLLLPIFLPVIGGAVIPFLHFTRAKSRELYVSAVVIINSLLVFALMAAKISDQLTVIRLNDTVGITLRIDGLSRVFGGLLAGLWPLASIYGFEYMKHEGKENKFFTFYTMTYGIAVGIAFSANLLTMYFFYEILTFITLPNIMHAMNDRAIHAGRKYLIYSITGAAFAFTGIMTLLFLTGTTDFVYGGILAGQSIVTNDNRFWVELAYLVTFLGFGVKAAIVPFHGWLPTAGVAPTPVTALLHAVAVVKSGVFAIMRITFYSFGTETLAGTWVQKTVMSMAIITIVFGSAMAVKEQHLKRRLAYSTVSNLSYILFGVTLMNPVGLKAAFAHMIFHGIMKICLFFCAGAVICRTGREYVDEIKGFGRKMPVTMGCFVIASLALIGIPGLCGFTSKWYLASAAVQTGGILPFIGILALVISALLTAIYLFSVIIKAYFPGQDFAYDSIADVRDPGNYIKIPLILLCEAMLLFGLFSGPIMRFFERVAVGIG